jgi:hypothetical protein
MAGMNTRQEYTSQSQHRNKYCIFLATGGNTCLGIDIGTDTGFKIPRYIRRQIFVVQSSQLLEVRIAL